MEPSKAVLDVNLAGLVTRMDDNKLEILGASPKADEDEEEDEDDMEEDDFDEEDEEGEEY